MATEAITQESVTESSAVQTPTSESPAPASPTSATTEEGEQESIDLGTKAADEAKPEAEAEDAPVNELLGAPAEGEDYVIEGLPEGASIDADAVKLIDPIAREIGLSNAGFSKLAGAYAEHILPRVATQVTEGLQAQVVAQRAEWEGAAIAAIKGTTELKNAAGEALKFDGKSLKDVQAVAARALDQLAPTGFRKLLEETGLGQHPGLIAFTYQAGLKIGEDTDFSPSEGAAKPLSRTEKYYGK